MDIISDVAQSRYAVQLPWWVHPAKLLAFFIIPLYAFVYCIPLLMGPNAIHLRFLNYFTWEYFALGLLFLVVVTNGAVIGALQLGKPAREGRPMWISVGFLDFLAIAAIVAYVIWFHRVLINPAFWLAIVGAREQTIGWARGQHPTIPGITSAVQFAVVYVTLYWLVRACNHKEDIPARFAVYFWVIVGLTMFRVFFWAERLALVEIVIALGLVSTLTGRPGFVFRRRILLGMAPFLAVGLLIILFAVTEYYRSWLAFYHLGSRGDFWGFAMSRLASYYYTALNNGAGMLLHLEWPRFHLGTMLDWLYRFPVLGVVIRAARGWPVDTQGATTYLRQYADPEFNNLSGIFPPIYDLGIAGGLIYAYLLGCLMGYLYRTYRLRSGLGLVFYPVLYIALLEIMRINYAATTRAFPIIAVTLIGYVFFTRREPREVADRLYAKGFVALALGSATTGSRSERAATGV